VQDAVDYCQPGDRIQIVGDYSSECVILDKPIVLIGGSVQKLVLRAPCVVSGMQISEVFVEQPKSKIQESVVKSLTIVGCKTRVTSCKLGKIVLRQTEGSVVEECLMNDLQIDRCNNCAVEGCTVADGGVSIYESNDLNFEKNLVEACSFIIQDSKYVELVSNNIKKSCQFGV
jgi:hypothetical protein